MFTLKQLNKLSEDTNIGENFNLSSFLVKDLLLLWELGFGLIALTPSQMIYYASGKWYKVKININTYIFWQSILRQISSPSITLSSLSVRERLRRSFGRKAICCISAFRHIEKDEQNHKQLKQLLINKGYEPIELEGHFVQEEDLQNENPQDVESSYLVFCPSGKTQKDFIKDMYQLGKKYKQDSILLRNRNSKNAYYLGTNHSNNPGLGKIQRHGPIIPNKLSGFRSIPVKKGKLDFKDSFAFKNFLYDDVIDYPFELKRDIKDTWKLVDTCIYKHKKLPYYKVVITKNGVKKSAVVENKLAAKTLRDKVYTFDDFPPFFK